MLHLDTYTDPGAMRPLLQRGLPQLDELGLRIERLEVLHAERPAALRRAAGTCRISVCYEAEIGGTRAETGRRQILYGKVYPSSVRQRALAHTGAQSAPAWIDGLDMLVWAFPDDPGLPQLPRLLDPDQAAALMPEGAFADGGARSPQAEVLRYLPEARATLRWVRPGGDTLYAKTFSDEQGAALHARFQRAARAAGDPDAFAVGEPLGYDSRTRTFWQRGVDAPPLAKVVEPDACGAWIDAAARGLARLHAGAGSVETRREVQDVVDAARRRAVRIGRALPEAFDTARRVAQSLIANAPDATPLALTHGDFHLGQLRVRGDRLYLLGFEEQAIGDPMEDLASFVANCPIADAQLAERVAGGFCEAYARQCPTAFDERRLNWHLAAQWLGKSYRALDSRGADSREIAVDMLHAAHDCAARLGLRVGVAA